MDISQTLVTGIVIVIIACISAATMALVIPLYAEYSFSTICRNYSLMMETENGLSDTNREKLEKELNQMGLVEVTIEAPRPYEMPFNKMMLFKVKGTMTHDFFISIFEKKKRVLTFQFESTVLSRKVSN